jgi:ribulose-5-phosphate 4-epimerase/fuculose-1-phosphate aldolase
VTGTAGSRALGEFVHDVERALGHVGHVAAHGETPDLVLNLVDPARPRSFRRRARGTYVAALVEGTGELTETYPLLVRTLANIVLCLAPDGAVWFTTMERGHYTVHGAHEVVARLLPLATAKLVIDNEFRADLEPELWDGDELTEEIREAGRRIGELDLVPAPFPIEDLLDERDLRHVQRLYGIGGLSYGNLSARKDDRRFWMSASGVDKTRLETIGRDILLVSGYDAAAPAMILSVPPGVEPRRVSVDAIEHWMIYTAHPDVGAILHVHAWLEGAAATELNYPCGSEELARSVAALIDAEADPAHAAVGLRNHGITATGESLPEILERIGPRVLTRVPMS